MRSKLLAVHPVLGSFDVDRSIRFYCALGFELVWHDAASQAAYAVIQRDEVELHLQWNEIAGRDDGEDRPVYRFLVDDVDALHAEWATILANGNVRGPMDTSWGTREFHVRDPDRNGLQFYRPL